VTEQEPAPAIARVDPITEHDPDAVNVSSRPEDVVALTSNGGSPYVIGRSCPNVMVCTGLVTVSDTQAFPSLVFPNESDARTQTR
jgi:hypothetical protein